MQKNFLFFISLSAILFLSACQTDPSRQRRFDYNRTIRGMKDAIDKENEYPCEYGQKYKGERYCQNIKSKLAPGNIVTFEKVSCIGVDHPTAPKELQGQCVKEYYDQKLGEELKSNYKAVGNPEVLSWKN